MVKTHIKERALARLIGMTIKRKHINPRDHEVYQENPGIKSDQDAVKAEIGRNEDTVEEAGLLKGLHISFCFLHT